MGKTIKKIKNCPVHNFRGSIFQRGQLSGGEGAIFLWEYFKGVLFRGQFSRELISAKLFFQGHFPGHLA